MVDWNPNAPEVLGIEWLAEVEQLNRVWSGEPARMQRVVSTNTEDISSLRLSATIDPFSQFPIPTVIDIIEEGDEVTPLYSKAMLPPVADALNEGWVNEFGLSANLFFSINETANQWPGPAQYSWIQTTSPFKTYKCSVDTTTFAPGGSAENCRIGFVAVDAILGANTGWRKLTVHLEIDGTLYEPAAGALRNVHGYGAAYPLWWGELNPATGLPWTPADIADFGPGGSSYIRVSSHAEATSTYYPKVHALSLNVHYIPVENRKAVAVWRRPENMGIDIVHNVETDALLTVPSGTPGWAKEAGKNYLLCWRQSISPALYGPVVATDVAWNGLYQDLGPLGLPPGVAYPLHTTGSPPPPSNVWASQAISHDQFGRPTAEFTGTSRAAYAFVLERSLDGQPSVDSQPYRFRLSELEHVKPGQTVGQQFTVSSPNTYASARLLVVPPVSAESTATLTVRDVATGERVGGGALDIGASYARGLAGGPGRVRFVKGFMVNRAVVLPGVADGMVETPDHPSLNITGDIDIAFEITPNSVTAGALRTVAAKWGNGVDEKSWAIDITTAGEIRWRWSIDGSTTTTHTFSGFVISPDRRAYRVVVDVNDGAGNRVLRLSSAANIDSPVWTEEIENVVAGATSLNGSPSSVRCGNESNTNEFAGLVHALEVRNGISGPAAVQWAQRHLRPGVTFFRDATGKRWNVVGDASVAGFDGGAPLEAGKVYEVRLSSDSSDADCWFAYALDASLGPEVSFGGTTDGAWIHGTHHPDRTMLVNLVREPDAPGAFTATPQAYPITMPDDSTRDVEFVDLTWTAPATSLGAKFLRYEIERLLGDADDDLAGWKRVANVNGEQVLSWTDRSAPRGISATYRIRQIVSDGRISDWAESNPVTPAAGDYDIILTSNHRPELTVLLDSDPEVSYEFLSSAQDETIALHGADYQVVFSEYEDRGVGWKAGVELNFGNEPPVIKAGQRVFTPLLEITRASDIPYVVAMDFQGTHILGHVTPSDATQSQPGNVYKAALNIIPIATEEIPVEVDP